MRLLRPDEADTLRNWFEPEEPGPLVGLHVLNTGNGAVFVDRWPEPRCVLAEVGGNYALRGSPDGFDPAELQVRMVGFVDAPANFETLLRSAFPLLSAWDRVISVLPKAPPRQATVDEATVRRLTMDDAYQVFGLSPQVAWIISTWGGRATLAASGYAWGAFVDDRLVSVACSFFVGSQYEDIGVVTEPGFRGHGLSLACAAELCADIFVRGRRPSWSTTPDNTPSLRLAEKLGFVQHRLDQLFVVDAARRSLTSERDLEPDAPKLPWEPDKRTRLAVERGES